MRRLVQDTFLPERFSGSRFHLHSHPEGPADRLLVLVHGLGGSGYGTWGGLPARLFDGAGGVGADIAVFDYRSFHRRILRLGRGDVDAWAKELSGYLDEIQGEYRDVFLIGHSQGGLVAETVVRSRLTARALDGAELPQPLAALVLVAAPLAGSGWASPALALVVNEFRAMKRLSSRSADMQTFFATWVEKQNLAESTGGRVVLPIYAAVATNDAFVSAFSATVGVPAGQMRPFPHGHRSLPKPGSDDPDLVDWLQLQIDQRCDVRQQERRQRKHQGRPQAPDHGPATREVVTSFLTDPGGLRWSRVYDEACRAASTSDVVVQDRGRAGGRPVNLLVAVHADTEIVAGTPEVKESVGVAQTQCRNDSRMTVGITAVGPDHPVAVQMVRAWLGPVPADRELFVEGVADVAALRDVLSRLLQHVIVRIPHPVLRLDTAGPNNLASGDAW